MGVPNASPDSLLRLKSASATRNVLDWTESKLHRVDDCLHCDSVEDFKAKTESKNELMSNRGVDVLQRSQNDLARDNLDEQRMQRLRDGFLAC